VTAVAAIDCGTNAIRLLIAQVEPGRPTKPLARLMRIVRLGEGVDAAGTFSAAAIQRTMLAVDEYAERLQAANVQRLRFVATSASRDVADPSPLVNGVQARLGVLPEVISAAEEARLSYAGAVGGLPAGTVPGNPVVVDIGGGSTEFVTMVGGALGSVSIDVGCVRLAERHLVGDPATAEEISAIRTDVRALMPAVVDELPQARQSTIIGVAGTVTTVVAMSLGLDRYDEERIHGARITQEQAKEVAQALTRMTRDERAVLPFMHPGRVDVITAGSWVLVEAMRGVGADTVIAAETDILDGIVAELGFSAAT
jgi:exopolyphosphatase/guanosine-5'-triphosphate,3'-diphosphate pyrophosphatase